MSHMYEEPCIIAGASISDTGHYNEMEVHEFLVLRNQWNFKELLEMTVLGSQRNWPRWICVQMYEGPAVWVAGNSTKWNPLSSRINFKARLIEISFFLVFQRCNKIVEHMSSTTKPLFIKIYEK